MAKAKTQYACSACGARTPKWAGRCGTCGSWNTIVEAAPEAPRSERNFRLPDAGPNGGGPRPLSEIVPSDLERTPTGSSELDRVLGGGWAPGMLVLLGGEPGVGKSTLLLQTAARLGRVLYVSGEESPEQIRIRADRLGVDPSTIHVLPETDISRVMAHAEEEWSALFVDSIQTVFDPASSSPPGSPSQIKECAARLLYWAKSRHRPVALVGHATKDGGLAGPLLLEHMVDAVLSFEAGNEEPFRLLRALKNRFGSTSEVGVFEMAEDGLRPVTDPSRSFLDSDRAVVPGAAVTAVMEGSRPILVEVQALVVPAQFGTPRRTCSGFDVGRASLLAAVLERRARVCILDRDVFINVAGGVRIQDRSADLAVALALASSAEDWCLDRSTLFLGEVGLGGEIRPVRQATPRSAEAAKLGFTKTWGPARSRPEGRAPTRWRGIDDLAEAVAAARPKGPPS